LSQLETRKKIRSFIHVCKNTRAINEIHNLRNNKKIVKELGTKIEDLGSIRGTVLGIGTKI